MQDPKAPTGSPDTEQPADFVQESEAGFRILFLNHPQPMWVIDLQTLQFLEVNDAAIRHYGYSRAEFQGMLVSDIRPAEDIPRLLEGIAQSRTGRQRTGEWRHLLQDGRLIDVEIVSHNLAFGGREVQLVMVRDITKQKRAEEALRQAERKYRLIVEEAIVGIYQSAPNGRLLSANPAMARIFGFDSPDEMVTWITDIQPQIYVIPSLRDEFIRQMREQGTVRNFEAQVYRKDGSKIWLCINGRAVHEGDSIIRYEGSFEDITERKLLIDQLGYAQKQYRDIVENAIVGIFQSTPDGRYTSANPAMAQMMGYDSPQELLGSIDDLGQQVYVNPSRRDELKRLLTEQGVAKNFECEAYRKDGSKMWLSANVRGIFKDGVVVGFEGMNEDITQRKALEDQLRQAQKMEAVGQLAGGVAHDFNNALGVITGYSDLLQLNLPPGDQCHKYAEEIAKAGRRAAALTRQLLAFSRKQLIQPTVMDLNSATAEFEKMLSRLIGENIEFTFKRSLGLGRVRIDPGQLEQILMNLAVNSRDAMPHGGQLSIETANVELDEVYARQNAYVIPGSYVLLSVSDTGCGMDQETQSHIFEPFFTTKELGKGTGLGLSTVYGIAKQNAGYVMVASEVGKGTTFKLYLPRLSNTAELPAATQDLDVIPNGTETVLVVEDEESLRILARTCLESSGYLVLDAPNATTGLELAQKHHGQLDLLLTDVIMPGMSGGELARRLMAVQPQIKVVYMSGYTNDLIDRDRILNLDTLLLEKPFTLHSLLTKVYQALHPTRNGRAATANTSRRC